MSVAGQKGDKGEPGPPGQGQEEKPEEQKHTYTFGLPGARGEKGDRV